MQLAKQKEEIARQQVNLEKAKNNSGISTVLCGGAQNGYVPELNAFKPNI